MAVPQFETLLRETIGLDPDSLGSSVIERAVRARQQACKLPSLGDYWDKLKGSDAELTELIEEIVVPETWFFRDREAFAALAGPVLREWARNAPLLPLRLLSMPCSTGEEPYSMAMALFDAGVAPERFRIDAVDISTRALAHAKKGVYTSNSFRGDDLHFRERHFDATPAGWKLHERIRRQVTLRQGNLMTGGIVDVYDVVFCRNLMIYFDRPTQDVAIKTLRGVLAESGFMFVGPSETSLLGPHGFVSAKWPLAFAFRKNDPAHKKPRPAVAAAKPAPKAPPPPVVAPPPPPPPRAARKASPDADIARAALLADEGRTAEAAKLCEQLLRHNGPSAPVFHLLGLIHDAAGDPAAAIAHYRKALYLDPKHHEAVSHLALLLERQGDGDGARVLRQRAARLHQKRTS